MHSEVPPDSSREAAGDPADGRPAARSGVAVAPPPERPRPEVRPGVPTRRLVLAFFLPPSLTPEAVKYDRRYRALDKYRFVAWFTLLPLAFYLLLVAWPFVQAFYYSMTDWSGYGTEFNFIGFDNYTRLWSDSQFWDATRNSLVLLVFAPVITLALGLFFAYMLNAGGRHRRNETVSGVFGSKFYKVVYFFPQVLSVAIIAVIWARAFSPRSGVVNPLLENVGLGALTQNDWLGKYGLWVTLLVLCWSFVGFYVVLFSASMGSIPKEIYEASLLDGANRSTTFFRITFPLTWDAIRTGWIYMGIQALDAFAIVSIMIPRQGIDVLPTFLYLKAFRDGQAAYATAVGVVLFLITLTFALLMMRVGRRDRIEF
ncbi:carbohydrate ABC transporter permease [Streptomyces bohaiensis]|uniref:Sugar ABC transporter permease n=1 Tax=Streptomyces bohaiensis TaxID=1431344 RepID=A0ABX1C320_9ACTN|nr:sugar ABC transporter permease [Streptomyces bohaiensis]NJQ13635.1 sugar ABC transporter permease [Streptomyces bohaiensis]